MARDRMLEKAKGLVGPCACGRMHGLKTREIYIGRELEERLAFYAMDLAGGGRALAVFDRNTYAALGERVLSALRSGCGGADALLLQGEEIHADSRSVGDILLHVTDETRLLVAVGSGTINDSCRYVAHRLGLPYLVAGTAPSMDGYASSVSPVLVDGLKLTVEAVAPAAVLLDPGVLARAPKPMLAAGLGDMLGKHIALLDWSLAAQNIGESFCQPIASLMEEAVALCEESAGQLPKGDEGAVAALGRGLCLSGLAMQLMGNSRPASGGEHHISHFLELKQMQRGEKPALHGDKVGVATLYMIEFYHRLYEKRRPLRPVDLSAWKTRLQEGYGPAAEGFLRLSPLERGESTPLQQQYERYLEGFDAFRGRAEALYAKREEYRGLLLACQGPVEPEQLGVSKQDMKQAMLCAFLLRPRYASLRMAFYFGWLEEIVDEIFA